MDKPREEDADVCFNLYLPVVMPKSMVYIQFRWSIASLVLVSSRSGSAVAASRPSGACAGCPGACRRGRGPPEDLDALAAHDGIGILRDRHVEPWRFQAEGRRVQVPDRARLRVGHVEAALLAARAGLGLAQLPLWLARPLLEEGHWRRGVCGRSWRSTRRPACRSTWPGRPTA